MKKNFAIAMYMVCVSLTTLSAQTVPDKQPSPQWWFSSSFADSIDRYLYHAEGQFSYTKMAGSIAGETKQGSVRAVIRKNIFTHQSVYKLDKMNLTLEAIGLNYDAESHTFFDYLDVDITRLVYAETGFIWERDNSLQLNNRYSFYVGVGVSGKIFENHSLNILVAPARITQDYTIPVDAIDVVKGAHTDLYLRQQYIYTIDQRVSISEQASYLQNLNDFDRYRWNVGLDLRITIVQPVSLVLGYSYKMDDELKLLGAVAANSTQTLGINISL